MWKGGSELQVLTPFCEDPLDPRDRRSVGKSSVSLKPEATFCQKVSFRVSETILFPTLADPADPADPADHYKMVPEPAL